MHSTISHMVTAFEKGRLSRREFIGGLSALVATGARPAHAADASPFQAIEPNHVALRVTDVARSRDFYRHLLGLTPVRDSGSSCFLDMDTGFVALFQNDVPGLDHYCLAIKDYDVRRAERLLRQEGLTPRVQQGRIYFRDPDGIEVQLAARDHKP